MSAPTENMPADVREVHLALLKNAAEHWSEDPSFANEAVYTRMETEDGQEIWFVSCNFEGFGPSMLRYPDGAWKYRDGWDGRDTAMKGGHAEALACASIYFTG